VSSHTASMTDFAATFRAAVICRAAASSRAAPACFAACVVVAACVIAAAPAAGAAPQYDLVIRHGRVLDGAGNPWVRPAGD
jgi:hypothetical protein